MTQLNLKANIHAHIVGTWLNGDERGFDDDTDLQHAGILDSFSTLELVNFLGDTYAVQLDPADINAETFKSVNTVAQLVSQKLPARK
jgi:acyl carrier protein